MRNILISVAIIAVFFAFSCDKEDPTPFENLTSHVWEADSLLANGVDASGSGQLLEQFNGDAEFNEDGTGTFGVHTGTWELAYEETKIIIASATLAFPLTMNIVELTQSSLKTTTSFPNQNSPANPIAIRMTFVEK